MSTEYRVVPVELLPCPFCGNYPDIFSDGDATCATEMCPGFDISCTQADWNKRANLVPPAGGEPEDQMPERGDPDIHSIGSPNFHREHGYNDGLDACEEVVTRLQAENEHERSIFRTVCEVADKVQAERDALKAEVEASRIAAEIACNTNTVLIGQNVALQSELTNERADTVKRLEWAKEAVARIDILESELTKARELLAEYKEISESVSMRSEVLSNAFNEQTVELKNGTALLQQVLEGVDNPDDEQKLLNRIGAWLNPSEPVCKTCKGTGIEHCDGAHPCTACSQSTPAAKDECTDGGKCGAGGYCDACPHAKGVQS